MAKRIQKLKTVDTEAKQLGSEQLRWQCPDDLFKFSDTRQLTPKSKIIGQQRAIEAIRTGLGIRNPGFNIFVSGLTGTGRSTTVKRILSSINLNERKIDDKLYVQNFKVPDYPRLIRLPAGQGIKFSKDMDRLLEKFIELLPGLFESERFKKKVVEVSESFREKQQDLFNKFEKEANKSGFAVVQIQMGKYTRPDIYPVYEKEPVSFEDLDKLVSEEKVDPGSADTLKKIYPKFRLKLDGVLSEGRKIEHLLQEEIENLIQHFGLPCIETHINDLREKYSNNKVNEYLDEIRDFTLENIHIFKSGDDSKQKSALRSPGREQENDPFKYYQVNLLVNNSHIKKAPVIIETAPNYKNLFGTIEKTMEANGSWTSDFMNIKSGSLLRADGGVLVLNLEEMISEPLVWKILKRSLKYGQLEIEAPETVFIGNSAIKPEPIKLDLKVVLIGNKQNYILLYNYDDSFKKIFKISADFTDEMPRNKQNIGNYANFIAHLAKNESLQPFAPSGLAAIVEESLRITGRQEKLSARFSDVADIAREANYWALEMKSDVIDRTHILRTIEERNKRCGLTEDRLRDFIKNGVIMIDTSGKKKAQINGLAVYDYGDHMFGKPSRITAAVSLGKAGVINIEREADLSGKIHDKGIAILTGFLRKQFAQDKPLAFSASICFEQSYGGIDGDSASSTELYLLLATLADVPIRQDLAVTGSVNQHGEIQPIGGVNEKIEGFYDVCKNRRLTGKQGVLIPHQNVSDLQLNMEVVNAVISGKFHIYPVETIEEGLEILTGYKAGSMRSNGKWEPCTLMEKINNRLEVLALGIQKFFAENPPTNKGVHKRPPKNAPCPPHDPRKPTRKEEDE